MLNKGKAKGSKPTGFWYIAVERKNPKPRLLPVAPAPVVIGMGVGEDEQDRRAQDHHYDEPSNRHK